MARLALLPAWAPRVVQLLRTTVVLNVVVLNNHPLASVPRRAGRWAWQKVLALPGCRGSLGGSGGSGGRDPSVPPVPPWGSCPAPARHGAASGRKGSRQCRASASAGQRAGGDLGGLGWCPHCFPSAPPPPPQELVCAMVSIFVFRMTLCEEVCCLRTSQLL